MDQKEELQQRVAAKTKALEAELARLRADARSAARERIERIEAQLSEAAEAVRDGWDRLTEAGAAKLNAWLDDDSTHQDGSA